MFPGLLLGAALLGAPVASPDCSEVTVVVVPAGEDAQVSCHPARAGRTAAELFEAAGHELTRVQRFPGAVCRVEGVPGSASCVAMPPADAYWGFFRATEGAWTYATLGVDAVVPETGEAVALAWQATSTPEPPAVEAAGAPEAAAGGGQTRGDAGGSAPADTETGTGTSGPGLPLPVSLAALAGLGGVALLVRRRRRP